MFLNRSLRIYHQQCFSSQVAMACPSLPKHINVAMVYTDSFHKVISIMQMTKEHLGELASACEFMDNVSGGSCGEWPAASETSGLIASCRCGSSRH